MSQLVLHQSLNISAGSRSHSENPLRSALFFCFWLSLFSLHAQSTFSVTPNPVYSVEMDGVATAEASITNLSATTDTFLWQREIIRFNHPAGSGCDLTLGDPFAHYILRLTAQKTFWLSPGATGPLIMDLYDFNDSSCCALIHLKITHLGNPADTTTVVYHMRECQTSRVTDLASGQVVVFPNPVQDVLSLKNAGDVNALRVFDGQGRLLGRFEAGENHRYSLQQFAAGSYFIALEDHYGRVFQVVPIQKKM